MKPEKRVVIWTVSEMTRSVLRILLDTHGYAPRVLESESEIWELAPFAHVCLVVGLNPVESERIEQRLHRECSCPCVIAMARGVAPEGLWVAQLLAEVKRATIRRRGPQPGAAQARARQVGFYAAAAS